MAETTTKALLGHIALDKKRIRISSKRQKKCARQYKL